jgi:hypothetical protein
MLGVSPHPEKLQIYEVFHFEFPLAIKQLNATTLVQYELLSEWTIFVM